MFGLARNSGFAAVILLLLVAPALAGTCQRDRVQRFTHDPHGGTASLMLITSAGRHLRVYGRDLVDAADWRTGDTLSLCTDEAGVLVTNLRSHEVLSAVVDR